MTSARNFRRIGLAICLLALVACDTAEERAEGHYERGMELLAEGRQDQALLEFKSALKLNEDYIAPRLEFARVRLSQGDLRGALGNYLKVIEVDQKHLEARLTAGRLFLQYDDDPDAAREHINEAASIAPKNEEARGLVAALAQKQRDYERAAELADDLLRDHPGNPMAVGILVAGLLQEEEYADVIKLINQALAARPDELSLHIAKLQTLEALDEQEAIGAQLAEMAERFPNNAQVAKGQVQWLLNNGETTRAIMIQREIAKTFADDPTHALHVAELLGRFEGPETARGELMALADNGAHPIVFSHALANFELSQGDPKLAIATLENLLTFDLAHEDRHSTQALLADINRTSGNIEQATEITTEILKEEPNHAKGLTLRALLALDDDRPHDAIADLRSALNVKPQDPEVLMLLSLAHERNGSPTLAQERMALAVQSSGAAPTESLRYAEFLLRQDKADIAVSVLQSAIEANGELVDLLAGYGQVQLATSNWTGATETVAKLAARKDNPEAMRLAQELQVAILNGEQRYDQSIGILHQMWDLNGDRTSAIENLVSSYIRAGKTKEATEFLESVLIDDVANLRANLLRGAVHVFEGELKDAEAIYRQVIEDHPQEESGYGALANLLERQGKSDEAEVVIETGLAKARNTDRLLFSRAARLEREFDFEGAIAIYERLYAANKVSDLLANNLASLLSEHRDNPADLERAYNIAKRLRASTEPAFLDTYGWVLYRRGDYELAIKPLQEAAEGALNNAIVQYHLGMAYAQLGQRDNAIEQLNRALELGQGTELPILEEAAAALTRLQDG